MPKSYSSTLYTYDGIFGQTAPMDLCEVCGFPYDPYWPCVSYGFGKWSQQQRISCSTACEICCWSIKSFRFRETQQAIEEAVYADTETVTLKLRGYAPRRSKRFRKYPSYLS